MWNVTYTNPNLNKWHRLLEHKGHLERMTLAKKMIDNSKPNQPKFFKNGAANIASKREWKRKINIDNSLLYKKMHELSIHPSPYNKILNEPTPCPAFQRMNYNKWRKAKDLEIENKKLKKRFTSAKPSVNSRKLDNEFNHYTTYLSNNIKKGKGEKNPNIDFITWDTYKKRLKICIERENMDIKDFIELQNKSKTSSAFKNSKSKNNTINNTIRPSSAKTNFSSINNHTYTSGLNNSNSYKTITNKKYIIERTYNNNPVIIEE
jgi:hypothetical protein